MSTGKLCLAVLLGAMPASVTAQPSVSVDVGVNVGADRYDTVAPGDPVESVDVFYDQLSPYGVWVDEPDVGRVFVPEMASFVPYTTGHWQYTNLGFVWISTEPFAWATTHYGRWAYSRYFGRWYWLPDTSWGPAWVEWRMTGSDFGWAPLPPDVVVRAGWQPPVEAWHYCGAEHVLDANLTRYYVPRDRVVEIHRSSRPLEHYSTISSVRVVVGPPAATLREHRVAVRPVRVEPRTVGRWTAGEARAQVTRARDHRATFEAQNQRRIEGNARIHTAQTKVIEAHPQIRAQVTARIHGGGDARPAEPNRPAPAAQPPRVEPNRPVQDHRAPDANRPAPTAQPPRVEPGRTVDHRATEPNRVPPAAAPPRAEPNRPEPARRPEPDRAEPGRTVDHRATEPNRVPPAAAPPRAEPNRPEPARRPEPDRAEPNRPNEPARGEPARRNEPERRAPEAKPAERPQQPPTETPRPEPGRREPERRAAPNRPEPNRPAQPPPAAPKPAEPERRAAPPSEMPRPEPSRRNEPERRAEPPRPEPDRPAPPPPAAPKAAEPERRAAPPSEMPRPEPSRRNEPERRTEPPRPEPNRPAPPPPAAPKAAEPERRAAPPPSEMPRPERKPERNDPDHDHR